MPAFCTRLRRSLQFHFFYFHEVTWLLCVQCDQAVVQFDQGKRIKADEIPKRIWVYGGMSSPTYLPTDQ